MKLGLTFGIRNHPDAPRPVPELYEDYVEDALWAEEAGFDHLWLNEHYLARDDYCPAAMPGLAFLAGRTMRIRLGPAVLCLAMHDPLRLALDAAVLDLVSGGRLDLGLGIGSRWEQEFNGLSRRDAWRRAWEAADFVERFFGPEDFSFDGEYYRYGPLEHTTSPVQNPVPIWWGGFAPQSMRRAARRGYNVFGAASQEYEDALVEAGRDPAQHDVAQIVWIHLGDSRDRAWDEAQYGLHWEMAYHRERGDVPAGSTPAGPLPELPPASRLREIEGFGFSPRLPVVVGTPDEALEALRPFWRGERGRITQLALTFRHPGMRTPEVRRSMELFAGEVLPRLQA
jgi:alkanesulfonate monooxygenase SsuD/methylene tetrahydromethanopterin reductase-like flavin-dependent oxidoreductase (luciferase family)